MPSGRRRSRAPAEGDVAQHAGLAALRRQLPGEPASSVRALCLSTESVRENSDCAPTVDRRTRRLSVLEKGGGFSIDERNDEHRSD